MVSIAKSISGDLIQQELLPSKDQSMKGCMESEMIEGTVLFLLAKTHFFELKGQGQGQKMHDLSRTDICKIQNNWQS